MKKHTQLQKVSETIHEILTMKRTKKLTPYFKENTLDRIKNTLLMQAIIGDSPEASSQMLGMIGKFVYSIFNELNSFKNVKQVIMESLAEYKHTKGKNMFKTSAQTINTALNEIPQKDIDQALYRQNEVIIDKLRHQGLWSNKVMLALDPNDKEYCGKYVNQYHTWGSKGQKETFNREYKILNLSICLI